MKQKFITHILVDIGIIVSYILLSTPSRPVYNQDMYYSSYIFYHVLVLTAFTVFYIYSPIFKKHFLHSTILNSTSILVSVAAAFILILLSLLLSYFFPIQNTITLPDNPILSLLLLTIVATKEELFFRNYVIQFGQRLGFSTSISITSSSLLFALGHLYQGLIMGLFSFMAGIFFCILLFRFQSIFACILCHGVYNNILYLLYYIST